MKRSLFLILILGFVGTADAVVVRDAHVEAELVSEVVSVKARHPFWVALRMKMDEHWHTYWRNPGDSGMATQLNWQLPEGWKASSIYWPAPKILKVPPLVTYGYEGEVFLLTKIFPSHTLGGIQLEAQWLACKVECIPGQGEFRLELPISGEVPKVNEKWVQAFSNARSALPLETSHWKITRKIDDQKITLKLKSSKPGESLSDLYFFPFQDNIIKHAGIQEFAKTDFGYELHIPRSTLVTGKLKGVEGVLQTSKGWRGENSETTLKVRAQKEFGLKLALLFAFLGGLILNLMPCVLPVLSIKILNFVGQARENRFQILRNGIEYSFGVVISFWVLAALLLFFRAGGEQIGWGFHLQSPWFVGFLILLFSALTLNLFGIFEITLPLPIANSKSHFMSGILATVVATPCTAPFMGAALGYAITQPAAIAFFIFTGLGLGMAFPFLILAAFPKLLSKIPKPGPWMIQLKRLLGFLLLATVFWLVWVFAQQVIPQKSASIPGEMTWQAYSEDHYKNLRDQGEPVFIDFTAAWCLTCQVNKRVALQDAKVKARFKRLGVHLLQADWTSRDSEITQALARYGRSSVPLYVYYPRNSQKAEILPEILTPEIVLETVV